MNKIACKISQKISRIFYFLTTSVLLWLTTGSAFADNTTLTDPAVTNHTDLSIAYLAQVFGNVGNVLHGTSGQMLGQLMYKFNEGILVVAGAFLIYSVVTTVIKGAIDHQGIGKNLLFTFLKITLGIALLIPNPATGYSPFQDLIMKVTIEGVALADQTWRYGLDYINDGGSLWSRPDGSESSSSQDSGGPFAQLTSDLQNYNYQDPQSSKMANALTQIFANEVCMLYSNERSAQQANNPNNPSANNAPNSIAVTTPSATTFNTIEVDANGSTNANSFQFPGNGNNLDNVKNGTEAGNCGSVFWGNNPGSTTGNVQGANCSSTGGTPGQGTCQFAKSLVSQMVSDVQPAAKTFFCSMNSTSSQCGGTSSPNPGDDNAEYFFGAMTDFLNNATPLGQSQQSNLRYLSTNFISSAEDEGWMMAGRYYWDLSQIASYSTQISNVLNYLPTVNTTQMSNVPFVTQAAGNYIPGALSKLLTYANASGAGDTGAAYPIGGKSASNWIIDALLGPIVGDMAALILNFSTDPVVGMGPDPIMFMHNVGMRCLGIAGDIWIILAIVLFGISMGTMFCRSTVDLQSAIKSVSDWIKAPLMIIAAALFGVGIILGFYVPLYPYMLFIFGVIGWIVSVIEAMVAAPLICLGLTHPEGHDFLGEGKQALMLLLSVFIRPVLMVIGLIAAMIISYVSLRILVYTYSGFLSDIFYTVAPMPDSSMNGATGGGILPYAAMATAQTAMTSGSIGALVMCIFVFPMFLVIFTAMVYVITTYCFNLIFVLPDTVLKWIGGPTSQSMGAQMASQVQSVVSGAAQTASQSINKGIESKAESNTKAQHKLTDDKKDGKK